MNAYLSIEGYTKHRRFKRQSRRFRPFSRFWPTRVLRDVAVRGRMHQRFRAHLYSMGLALHVQARA
jgi:hypothetical protein